ncbi:hypothetical protein HDU91_000275 [Kappamyces sp. JEL0680]|nr:hypothetical protein HDU91_000275 [Kappamyces sp. JEL0680]
MTQLYVAEAKQVQLQFRNMKAVIKANMDEIFDTPVLPVPSLVETGEEEEGAYKPQPIAKPVLAELEWWLDAFDH